MFWLFSFSNLRISGVAIVGDITPSDGVPKLEKSRREREALDHMCKLLGGGPRGVTFCLPSIPHSIMPLLDQSNT